MDAKEHIKKSQLCCIGRGIDVVLKCLSSPHSWFPEGLREVFVWGLEQSIGKET